MRMGAETVETSRLALKNGKKGGRHRGMEASEGSFPLVCLQELLILQGILAERQGIMQ